MNRKQFFIGLLVLLTAFLGQAQSMGQVIKGKIVDAVSQVPLPGASVVIMDSNPLTGTMTDADGNFKLPRVAPGRYNLLVSFMGYENYLFREVLVGTGKEVVLNAGLKESAREMDEVKVISRTSKELAVNPMSTISARQLSVEEASRYAGGYDDPARLAGSFAGVASEMGNNGIVIRGNSSRYMLWKLEGVEISNPTHFADVIAFGAGGITALSSQMLANSDFFTGAFPAEYGNALSGVFDVKLRTGNAEKRESALQIGGIGIDVSSEGPLRKGGKSSYLFNYRYSTLALLKPLIPKEAGLIKYQDLSFKFNFPTQKSGTFVLWGIGALDAQSRDALTDPAQWENNADRESFDLDLSNGAIGLTHKLILNPKTYLHTGLASSGNSIATRYQELDSLQALQPRERVNNDTWKFSASTTLNHKFGARHFIKTGVVYNQHFYNVDNREAPTLGEPLLTYALEEGNTASMQAFSQSNIQLPGNLEMVAGLLAHYFTLNNELSLEPRLGLKWKAAPAHSFGIAYGLNSRIEMIGFYLARQQTSTGIIQPNRNLKMSKAQHYGLAWDWMISKDLRLKVEPYFQHLYDIPVVDDSYFSLQNLELDWFFNETLVNKGTGSNLGVDFTLERFLKNDFYYLFTASLFDSKYTGGDDIERDGLYNKHFIFNLLAGKEWKTGKLKRNILGLNSRFSYLGGDRYTPILEDESIRQGEILYDYSQAYTLKEKNAAILSFSLSYRINKPGHAGIWSFHLLNALGNEEFRGYEINPRTHLPEKKFDRIMVPNVSYKIEF
ncbi:MAG TPA: TonB-dependent receptor [Prolixibacteraceae bacterium]|nr:TonB-dependent receptor [Prolixibacteraceae bacterium]